MNLDVGWKKPGLPTPTLIATPFPHRRSWFAVWAWRPRWWLLAGTISIVGYVESPVIVYGCLDRDRDDTSDPFVEVGEKIYTPLFVLADNWEPANEFYTWQLDRLEDLGLRWAVRCGHSRKSTRRH